MIKSVTYRKGIIFGNLTAIVAGALAWLVHETKDMASSMELLHHRSLIFILIISLALYTKKVNPFEAQDTSVYLRAVFGFVGVASFYFTLQSLNVGIAILLANTSPIFVILGSMIWLKEKVHFDQMIYSVLVIIAVVINLDPSIENVFGITLLVALLGSFSKAAAFVSLKTATSNSSSFVILWYLGVFSFFGSFFFMNDIKNIYSSFFYFEILSCSFLALLAQYLLTETYKNLNASLAVIICLLSVFWGSLFQFIWSDSTLLISQIMANTCLLLSIVLLVRSVNKDL